ncbi:inactive pancreatic lipase-related protein 1 [Drosophila subobscura]|uniref:inactive pancreatic lipase-related protein 1 n=1 Tax=Drosophila subobscura TaxID=7241 RepID=UPI00155A1B0A|nr:inactive pancreatic lipase-related protein 1 [Drosophila subobscura]XP_034669538.1 inactive pancreatic lipase-related protein 1 [Drosophila subobscura]
MHKAIKNKSRLLCGLKNAKADLTTAKFILYYGPTVADSDIYDLKDHKSLLEDENLDLGKNTVLYLHGYLEDPDVESINVIAEAYLERKDTNLIVLDWGELADGNYIFDAMVNAKQLAPELAKVLLEMFDHGLDIEKFHIVGHSMGGQLAGNIGREIFKRTKGVRKIKRISALDPAFPLYYPLGAHLTANDAEFVDVIHTDAWLYGAPTSTGTADFWPNGGNSLQPGCPKRNYKMLSDNDLSSHRRSWWFWAESVSDRFPIRFDAVPCRSWSDFKQNKTTETCPPVVMGHHCPTTIQGNFYLQTNGQTPFARGKEGTIYVDPKELLENTHGYSCEPRHSIKPV